MQIAILEDDAPQAELIHTYLRDAGHQCSIFETGESMLAALARGHGFDMLVLDWEIPDISGLDVLRWVRSTLGHELPVVFLTCRTLEEDLVIALQAGADDYIMKPIRRGELTARIAALFRRLAPGPQLDAPFRVGAYDIDPARDRISLDGKAFDLAPKEYELAILFFRNPNRLFSRDVLSSTVWNRMIPATSRTLDTHLSNIRRKLHLRPENGVRLISSYALGYRLELLADQQEPPSS